MFGSAAADEAQGGHCWAKARGLHERLPAAVSCRRASLGGRAAAPPPGYYARSISVCRPRLCTRVSRVGFLQSRGDSDSESPRAPVKSNRTETGTDPFLYTF